MLFSQKKLLLSRYYFEEIRKNFVLNLLLHRRLPYETTTSFDHYHHDEGMMNTSFSFTDCASRLVGTEPFYSEQQMKHSSSGGNEVVDPTAIAISICDSEHCSKMRSLALRTVSNALSCVGQHHQSKTLLDDLLATPSSVWITDAITTALVDDIQKGSCRPVQAVITTRFATQHDAAVACRILGQLAQHHSGLKQKLLFLPMKFMDCLEQTRLVGMSTHFVLAEEARRTSQILTEDERSC